MAIFALVFSSAGRMVTGAEPGDPSYVNRIMNDFSTPTVVPGKTLIFSFNVSDPYEGASMTGIVLTVGIYKYATKDEVREVNESFPHAPLINGEFLEYKKTLDSMPIGGTIMVQRVSFAIETSHKTPHGTYFSSSAYFLRFNLTFSLQSYSAPVVLKSRGYFTDEQWRLMFTNEDESNHSLNVDYMHSLGVSGIIPDSSFGLKAPIPRWPLVILGIATGGAAVMAVYYFVIDNPGKYPPLEKRFYYLRGKLSELRRKLQNRRRK